MVAVRRINAEKKLKIAAYTTMIVVIIITCIAQHNRDNRPERIGFKLSVYAYNKDWNRIINFVKKNDWLKQYQNYHQMINFYYDMALAEKGYLPDKMFGYPQRLGINGLFVDDPMATVICLPTAMLFDNMGLATNALHYAFEAQTTYENSHYVMRYVIDNLLIIGDYPIANRYLNKYSNVMLSKKYVNDRKKYLYGFSSSELKQEYVDNIRSKHPRNDFYMGNSQYDALQVVAMDKTNSLATQYLLASALLQNDLDLFMNLLLEGYGNVNFSNLPRAYQEAVLLYRAISKEIMPGTEKIHIQSYVLDQFKLFQQVVLIFF